MSDKFHNFYRCEDCDKNWECDWRDACNDECSSCKVLYFPYKSEVNFSSNGAKAMIRGQRIYYNDGELAFENVINTKADVGTHAGIFLEETEQNASGERDYLIINQYGRLEIVQKSLVSVFNI